MCFMKLGGLLFVLNIYLFRLLHIFKHSCKMYENQDVRLTKCAFQNLSVLILKLIPDCGILCAYETNLYLNIITRPICSIFLLHDGNFGTVKFHFLKCFRRVISQSLSSIIVHSSKTSFIFVFIFTKTYLFIFSGEASYHH